MLPLFTLAAGKLTVCCSGTVTIKMLILTELLPLFPPSGCDFSLKYLYVGCVLFNINLLNASFRKRQRINIPCDVPGFIIPEDWTSGILSSPLVQGPVTGWVGWITARWSPGTRWWVHLSPAVSITQAE